MSSKRPFRFGVEEAVRILKSFFVDEKVTFSGKYYTVTDLAGLPRAVQRPHPPLFIGGGGRRLLSLAAREADIIGLHFKVNSNGKVDPVEATPQMLAQK